MPNFKSLIITGRETIDPTKRKNWKFEDAMYEFKSGYMLVTKTVENISSTRFTSKDNVIMVKSTTVIPLSEIATYEEINDK